MTALRRALMVTVAGHRRHGKLGCSCGWTGDQWAEGRAVLEFDEHLTDMLDDAVIPLVESVAREALRRNG
jgi:hypothetical protein